MRAIIEQSHEGGEKMHECPFYLWVIFISIAVVFAIITGWFNLYVPKKNNDELAIRNRRKVIVKNRIGIFKVYVILIILVALSTISFLWWCFSIAKIKFDSFLSGLSGVGMTILVIVLAFTILAATVLFYAVLMATHMHRIELRYSKRYQEEIKTTMIED